MLRYITELPSSEWENAFPRPVALLGSTGSIGVNTLRVIEKHPDLFNVVALAGGRNVERLIGQALRWRPPYLGIQTEEGAGKKYDKNILWEEEGGKNRREEDDHVEERIREKKIGFIRKSERRREAYKEKGKGGWLENGQEKTCTKVKSKFWISFLQLRKTYGRLFIISQKVFLTYERERERG